MTFFACAIRTDGGPIPFGFRGKIEGASCVKNRTLRWTTALGYCGVINVLDGLAQPQLAGVGSVMGIGAVRLDNRTELLGSLGCSDETGDLELALRVLLSGGRDGIRTLLGDFAFVAWDTASRTVTAARDALGVKLLYYRAHPNGLLSFASRVDVLACDDAYDREYLTAHISYCALRPDQTVYGDVRALPAGSIFSLRRGVPDVTPYWTPESVLAATSSRMSARDQIDAFRVLLIDAVRRRVASGKQTWSQLSGGLDSSSVVSVAEWLAKTSGCIERLGGTITYTDPLRGSAEERRYSDAVVAHYGVRNETITHQTDWRGVLLDPPDFDQPGSGAYIVSVRDRQAAAIVRDAGGRVLLTGMGGDHLLMGTMFFFADWIADGQVGRAVREMVRRAARGRVSFWELAYKNAALPLMPAWMRHAVAGHGAQAVPAWIPRHAVRCYELAARTMDDSMYNGPLGGKYASANAAGVAGIQRGLNNPVLDDTLDVRHPFLDRPLVEFALGLAPDMCVRPHARKWILREALRGILPEDVRTRVGKSAAWGLLTWSIAHERVWIERLLDDSILAQLGCIDLPRLRTAIDTIVRRGVKGNAPSLNVHRVLETEMWLQLRSGRWGQRHDRPAPRTQSAVHSITHSRDTS